MCQQVMAGAGFRVDSPGPEKVRLREDCPDVVTVPQGHYWQAHCGGTNGGATSLAGAGGSGVWGSPEGQVCTETSILERSAHERRYLYVCFLLDAITTIFHIDIST